MYDIITFGSATQDVFLKLKPSDCKIEGTASPQEQARLCLPLGAKLFLQEMQLASGGGGSNTACTFARQGLKTAYCGKVVDDKQGLAVLDDLKKNGVALELCWKGKERPTAFSAVLSAPNEERTVLIYQGACHFLDFNKLPQSKLKKAKWFYIAPLSGQLVEIFEPLVAFALSQKIKVAANLGHTQINLGQEKLKSILAGVDVLILNQEEASLLAKTPPAGGAEILKSLAGLTGKGIIIITRGKQGCWVFDGQDLYTAGIADAVVVEKTGAGDAFASGFLAGLLQSNQIEYAIQLATANATSCIGEVGAKNGLLKKGQWGPWPKVSVHKTRMM